MANSSNITGSVVTKVAQAHEDTANTIKQQGQQVEDIINNMTSTNKGAMANACSQAGTQLTSSLNDIYTKLMDMSAQIKKAVNQYDSQDSDGASGISSIGQNMSPVGSFLAG